MDLPQNGLAGANTSVGRRQQGNGPYMDVVNRPVLPPKSVLSSVSTEADVNISVPDPQVTEAEVNISVPAPLWRSFSVLENS